MANVTINYTFVKTWLVTSQLGPDDFKWIVDIGCRLHVKTKEIPIGIGNRVHISRGPTEIEVVSFDKEQELMLKLKFAPSLILESSVDVHSATMDF